MRKLMPFMLIVCAVWTTVAQQRTVFGTVSDGRAPLKGVAVAIDGNGSKVETDAQGKYRIQADKGDLLRFTHPGFVDVEVVIEDVTRVLSPIMVIEVNELEGVTVTGSNRKSQSELAAEYNTNKQLIRTAYGYLDAETAAGNIRFLNEDEINPIGLCIIDLMRARFAGVRVAGNCQQGGFITVRGVGSITNPNRAIYDVDGQIFTDVPIWIDINTIRRIAILNNFATTTVYGSIASGGVIVINTVNGNPQKKDIVDQARLRNNYVKGPAIKSAALAGDRPSYMGELEGYTDLARLRADFPALVRKYGASPYFYLDTHRWVAERFQNNGAANGFMEQGFSTLERNPVLLKALAYQLDAQGQTAEALDLYQKVFKLRPEYAQSYRDLASAYRANRQYREAASMYTRFFDLREKRMLEADSSDVSVLVNREYNNLLMLHRDALVSPKRELYVEEEDFLGTRLVFEWNDGEAEFELQFVNPEGQFYQWKHTQSDQPARIREEKRFGYSSGEYLLDGSLPGLWKVNVTYLGNKSLTPTYLKITVYEDYGSKAQRQKTVVHKMRLKGVAQEVLKVRN